MPTVVPITNRSTRRNINDDSNKNDTIALCKQICEKTMLEMLSHFSYPK